MPFQSILPPGEGTTLVVDLPDGTYEFYCPAEDHREQGMEVELIITE